MSTSPIIGFIGKRGSGKTLLMTAFIYQMALEHEIKQVPLKIYSNYELFFGDLKYIDIVRIDPAEFRALFGEKQEAFKLRNAVFLLDEIAMWADSYDFNDPTVRKLCKFALQTRKRHITIMFSAQYMSLVPVRLRKTTTDIIQPKYYESLDLIEYGVFSYEDKYAYHGIMHHEQTLRIYGISEYFGLYDTDEVIEDIS